MTEENKWQVLADFENKLQDENLALKQNHHVLCDMYVDLQKENNALKAKLQNITVQSNNEITALKQENEKIRTRQIKLYIALDVIKDIAEKYSDSIDKANDALYSIIDKINEVIK